MNSNEMNGSHFEPEKLEKMRASMKPATDVQRAEQLLRVFVHQTMTVSARGMSASLPQVPPPVVMLEMARAAGEIISQFSSVGVLAPCMKLRADAKAAFEAGLRQHDIRPPVGPMKQG